MASLSDLPEPERRLAMRLAWWSWLSLALGALGIILWLRHVLGSGGLAAAFVLVLLFVAYEFWLQLFIRRVTRRRQG